MHGDVSLAVSKPAAVDLVASDGRLLDLISGSSAFGGRSLLQRRDFARDCDLLLAVAPRTAQLNRLWWDDFFVPEARILVITEGPAPLEHEGSRACAINLRTGNGIPELIGMLEAMSPRAS
jgi:hypothetical protein